MANNTMRPHADTAWGPKHIALYLDISERHLRDVRREDPSFPAPRMVGNRPRCCDTVVRRWVADGGSWAPAAAPKQKRRGVGRVH